MKTGRLALSGLLLLALVAGELAWWHSQSRPFEIAEPTAPRMACASYAPFRMRGETPFDAGAFATPQRIASDLDLLTPYTDCVRTYSLDRGLGALPAIAAEQGKRVLLGVWIDRDRDSNRRELARAIDTLRNNADQIDAVIVGNEVLLRRELSVAQLAALIGQVRAATDVPVTYADVWEFWIDNPELAAEVDFVTVNILPYWEDRPVAAAQAVAYVRDTYHRVRAMFPGQDVLIGEIGWPSAGRMRGPARPGRVEQARFAREWLLAAEKGDIPYNMIEAFDQPWKRRLEGAMGGHWGFLDSSGRPKFEWRGAVAEDPGGEPQAWLLAGVGAVAFAGLLRLWAAGARIGRATHGLALLAGAAAGLIGPAQWHYLQVWNQTWLDWTVGGLWLLLGHLGFLLMLPVLSTAGALPGVAAGAPDRLLRVWGWIRFAMLFGFAFVVLLLVFEPRYRGYPTALCLLPTVMLLLPWMLGLRVPREAAAERLLGLVILLGLPFLVAPEWPDNTQALGFSALAGLAGLAGLWPGAGPVGGPVDGTAAGRSIASRPSSPPKTPSSAV